MEIRFNPNDAVAGTCSFAAWSSHDLQNALRQAFHESPRGELYQIDVTPEGLRAYFVTRNATT